MKVEVISRRTLVLFLCILSFSNPLVISSIQAEENTSIHFNWALVYQDKEKITKGIDINNHVVQMSSGDKIKFYFQPVNQCYLYLFLYDSQKELFLLFPRKFDFEYQIGDSYILPNENSWYVLDDNSGVEVFHFIVSDRRLTKLETVTKRYLTESRSYGKNNGKPSMKYGILDEIRRLIKENSFLAGVAEKPVSIAGDFRGLFEEFDGSGKKIVATGVYAKTIRLQH